jgi:2-polyprenyl-6-methoxyphenol hydroxylase-like FAD-dependent oxidoreductase
MRTQVFISGGGVGGLTLALKLAIQGVQVILAEKNAVPGIKYKGELLQPKSLAILEQLGVLDEVLKHGNPIHRIHLSEYIGSRQYETFFDYNIIDHPLHYALMIPHETLKEIILTKAKQYENFTYLVPAKLTGFVDESTVTVMQESQKLEIKAHIIVGAEGRSSVVRAAMHETLEPRTYNHHFLTVTCPRPAALPEARIVSRGSRFIGLFPLANNRVRTVAMIHPEQYRIMQKQGLQSFYQYYHELVPAMEGAIEAVDNWKLIQLMIPLRYHAKRYVLGRYAILGDAAHSVHPMAGEGMNLAIQDADVLGQLMGWMYAKHKTPDLRLLQWYERVRRPRASLVMGLSHISGLTYSYSPTWWLHARFFTMKTIQSIHPLHLRYMANLSGLGQWFRMIDRHEDYPWQT